jgi:hypothetical protein
MTSSPTSNALSAPTNEFPSQGKAAIPHHRGRTQGLSPAKVPTTGPDGEGNIKRILGGRRRSQSGSPSFGINMERATGRAASGPVLEPATLTSR